MNVLFVIVVIIPAKHPNSVDLGTWGILKGESGGKPEELYHLEPSGVIWSHLEVIWSHLVSIWTHVESSGAIWSFLDRSGVQLEPSRVHLEPSGVHLEPPGVHLGPSGVHLQPSGVNWRHLESIQGRLESSGAN